MTKYVRLCKTTNTKGEVIPFDEVDITHKVLTEPNSDWYTSLFRFDKEAFEYFTEHESINGFKGKATLDELVFDLDCKEDVDKARKNAITLLTRLKEEGVNVRKSTKVFFSGSKGFHVHVLLGKDFTNHEIKNICFGLSKDLGTFDRVVYNTTRLFRVPNTKHNSSGLYKIPLSPTELYQMTVEDIKDLAKAPREYVNDFEPVTDLTFLDKYNKKPTHTSTPVVVSADDNDIRGLDKVDFKKCPKAMPRCVYALTHGVMQSGAGHRSAVFLRLAAFYMNQGQTKEAAYGALKGIARDNARLYPEHEPFTAEEIWNTAIQSVYGEHSTWEARPGTTGIDPENEHFKHYCEAVENKTDIPCCLHHRHSKPDTVQTISSIENSFDSFATNFDKNIVKTGVKLIDDYMKIAIGTTTLIAGACGSGKTTLCLNIMENANAMNQHTMFFSLDMNKNLIYLKLAQKLTPYSQDEILNFYKNRDMAKINEIKKAIDAKYSKTYFDFSSTLTIEAMRDKVLATEEKNGIKIKLAVVDYASRVTGQYSDSYANARYNALKSTEVAGDTDVAWIWLNQVSRNAGNGASPLRSKRVAKDSGDWEESATNVITCWRPFMGVENGDDIMRLFLAKNRMGREIERPLHWDGAKGKVWDMTSQEYIDYQAEREPVEKEMLKKNSSFGNN